MPKTLVIFASHILNDNLKFFINHGYFTDESTDFYIVLNNLDLNIDHLLPTDRPNLYVVNRENHASDFGSWSAVLLKDDKWKQYDYFMLINTSIYYIK